MTEDESGVWVVQWMFEEPPIITQICRTREQAEIYAAERNGFEGRTDDGGHWVVVKWCFDPWNE